MERIRCSWCRLEKPKSEGRLRPPRVLRNPSAGRAGRRATGRQARYCSGRRRQAARRQRLRATGKAALRVTKPVSKPRSAWEARDQELQRPLSEVLAGQRQELIRRPARELLRMLRQVKGII
jgi:hypothetical protein